MTLQILCPDGHQLKLLVYRPGDEDDDAPAAGGAVTGVLWIHGGGYVTGMAAMAHLLGRPRSLVKKFGAVVVSPEYSLSPAHRYPVALEECYTALRYMVDNAEALGIRRDQIFVGGESAGGGLAAALCLLARDRGEIHIAFQMPLYPMIDDRDTPSSRDNHNIVWNTRLNHFGWSRYLGDLYGTPDVPKYAAPARETNFEGLPPAYTFVCSGDPFYTETIDYFGHLRLAGIPATCDTFDGLFHAFDIYLPLNPATRAAIEGFETAFLHAQAHYLAPNP